MYRSDGHAPTSSGCGCSGSTRTAGCGCGGGCSSGSCGCGLQCLSRPRFFDGQLVTAADFGRLDSYAVAKSRLHNRYLHGVGVVCGLEAVCNSCDDTVTVRAGYALGPCGEDIVVCQDTRVDVGELVREHRKARVRPDCPPYTDRPVDCEAARQKWVLGICYDERPARPTTSLRRRSACGCGTTDSGTSAPTPSGTRVPTGCEPTSVCEGFRFTVTKLAVPAVRAVPQPGTTRAAPAVSGELPERVRRCLELLRSGLTRLPQDPELDELVTYCCDLRSDLRDLIDSGNAHDCSLGQRLGEVVCPDPQDEDARARALAAISAMLQIAVELYRSCVCSALLPPCDTGCGDDCVPLAVVTVRSSDLRVLDICNWSGRQFAVTAPALSHWFGWLPIFDALRALVERLCCEQGRRAFAVDERLRVRDATTVGTAQPADDSTEGTQEGTGPVLRSEAAVPAEQEIASLLELAAAYARAPSAMSGVDTTVLGALGALTPESRPLASEVELANPLPALALGRGFGAVRAALTPEVLTRLRLPEVRVDRGAGEPPDDRLARLELALAGLQQTVDEQAETIRSLREQAPPA